MLFRKKIEPRCSYCARGGRANDHEVICAKKGIVPAESHCGAFRYDPLKRVPPRPAKLETEELAGGFPIIRKPGSDAAAGGFGAGYKVVDAEAFRQGDAAGMPALLAPRISLRGNPR